jgi:uncharacterized membrane protein YphA (DoxX/SURF4 family)
MTIDINTDTTQRQSSRTARKTTIALWTVQGLLALLFLFAGGMKLIVPIEALAKQSPLPGLFLRFIGLCEVAGALGLVLPRLLRIRQGLTPLAAAALAIIMLGATIVTIASGPVGPAFVPFVVGLLLVGVAYGRRSPAPRRDSAPTTQALAA